MKLSAIVEAVRRTDEEAVITKNGVPVAVLVSPHEFESRRESMDIRLDPGLMDEIRRGLADLKAKLGTLYTLHP